MSERANPGTCPEKMSADEDLSVTSACGLPLERVYLSREQNAQRFSPIVVHQYADGTYSLPMSAHAPIPEGARKIELTTWRQADRVMAEVNAIERRKIEEHVANQQHWLNEAERQSRRDLDNGFVHTFFDEQGRSETRTIQGLRHMSPAGRAFAAFARMMNDRKARPQMFDANAYIEVREFDRSNRDGYRDSATNWRTRRD
jgi:hypothetical protein